MVNFDSPATFLLSIGLAYSIVFFTHLAFAESTWQDTLSCAVFANEAMKYKGLVDPKNKPFGNLLPLQNLPAFPVPLEQTFQSSWHFRFQAVAKVFLLLWKTNHILAFTVLLTFSQGTNNSSKGGHWAT